MSQRKVRAFRKEVKKRFREDLIGTWREFVSSKTFWQRVKLAWRILRKQV